MSDIVEKKEGVSLKDYLNNDKVKQSVISMIGNEKEYNYYVASFLSFISQNKNLQRPEFLPQLKNLVLRSFELRVPVNSEGYAYLIPYKDDLKLIISYKGLLKRAKMNDNVSFIKAEVVYSDDEFDCYTDENGYHLKHKPSFTVDRNDSNIKCAYAILNYKDGKCEIEVMAKSEIEKVKNISVSYKFAKDKSDTIWSQWYSEMAKKSVLRRLLKNSIVDGLSDIVAEDNKMYDLEKDNKPKSMMDEFLEPKEVIDEKVENIENDAK